MDEVQKLTHTQGDTFRVSGALTKDGVAVDITSYGIAAQVMDGAAVVAELVRSDVDSLGGLYQLVAQDTDAWPVKDLTMNIRYTLPSGDKTSTRKFYVSVQRRGS